MVFVIAVFVFGLVAWLAKKMIEAIGLRPADRSMGALFGLVRGGVLLLVVAVIVGLTPLRDNAWWKESLGAYVLTQVLESLRPALPQEFGSLLPSWE